MKIETVRKMKVNSNKNFLLNILYLRKCASRMLVTVKSPSLGLTKRRAILNSMHLKGMTYPVYRQQTKSKTATKGKFLLHCPGFHTNMSKTFQGSNKYMFV